MLLASVGTAEAGIFLLALNMLVAGVTFCFIYVTLFLTECIMS
jgi:hypothetical protein